jgi:hypothetical protein
LGSLNLVCGAVPLRDGAVVISDVDAVLRIHGFELHELRFAYGDWPGHVAFVGLRGDGEPVRGVVVADWMYDDGRAVLEAHVRVDQVGEEPEDDGLP